jgi:hypothetical protein
VIFSMSMRQRCFYKYPGARSILASKRVPSRTPASAGNSSSAAQNSPNGWRTGQTWPSPTELNPSMIPST